MDKLIVSVAGGVLAIVVVTLYTASVALGIVGFVLSALFISKIVSD